MMVKEFLQLDQILIQNDFLKSGKQNLKYMRQLNHLLVKSLAKSINSLN